MNKFNDDTADQILNDINKEKPGDATGEWLNKELSDNKKAWLADQQAQDQQVQNQAYDYHYPQLKEGEDQVQQHNYHYPPYPPLEIEEGKENHPYEVFNVHENELDNCKKKMG